METFYGPIHFDSVDKNGMINSSISQKLNLQNNINLNISGIYIWGFVYSINEKGEIIEVIEFKKDSVFNPLTMKFIPYYVGIGDKTSIYNRLKQHHKPTKGNASKYIRLSVQYMKTFFTDIDFPVKYSRNKNNQQAICCAKHRPGLIEYFNDGEFLNIVYPNKGILNRVADKQNWPITNYNFIPDTLNDFVNFKNNFWFCFMPIDNSLSLRDFEVETFYGLKGITVSDTKKYQDIKHITNMKDLTTCDIFKHKNNSNDIEVNNNFCGY